MPKYYVQVQVCYDGEIVADSEEQAEEMAWSAYYGDDATLEYSSVESIEVEEQEEDEEEDEEDEWVWMRQSRMSKTSRKFWLSFILRHLRR
jgi:hypothetical protein